MQEIDIVLTDGDFDELPIIEHHASFLRETDSRQDRRHPDAHHFLLRDHFFDRRTSVQTIQILDFSSEMDRLNPRGTWKTTHIITDCCLFVQNRAVRRSSIDESTTHDGQHHEQKNSTHGDENEETTNDENNGDEK